LLEVAAITGQAELGRIADRAFAYERSLFDAGVRNWPDLQTRRGANRGSFGPASYPVAWCHGAAGIALARLRAYELTGLSILRQEAEVALETTIVHTAAVLRGRLAHSHSAMGWSATPRYLNKGIEFLARRARSGATSR
jgi:lantibiotic modifying enzyme